MLAGSWPAQTVPGVAGIDVIGGYVKKYAVRPDPARMTAYGVGLNEVVEAVEHANTVAGAGYISRGGEAFVVRADARVRSAEDLAAAPIKNHNGLVVRVSDVATVEITPQPPSAFTSRMAACASGIAWPMPLQCGTWKKRFFVVTGPLWTGSNRMS